MAETAWSVTSLAQYSVGVADAGFEAADQTNGNTFTNNGRTVLVIANADASPTTCTVTAVAGVRTYNEALTKAVTVTAGTTGVMGPFPTQVFGTAPTFAWTNDTSITVAAVDLAAALDTPK